MYRHAYLAACAAFALLSCSAAVYAADPQPAPIKVLVLPADMKVYSLTANGDIEDAPDATHAVITMSDNELKRLMTNSPVFKPVAMPALSADEQATLKEHVALYKMIANDTHIADEIGDAWKTPLAAFTYTLGPGLQFLKQRSGADYALILQGEDAVSTGGRVGMSVFAALLGVQMAKGRNYICAGLVDLDTGNVVWLNYDTHNASDFDDPKKMPGYVDDILQDYPDGSLHAFAATPGNGAH